jgi:hypothetical protein
MFSAPHTATVGRLVLNYSLNYDGGSAVFTAGKTLTGVTSHATATIVSTGSAASGTLVIHSISGTFQNDEVLSDNGTIPGAAVVNGTASITLDTYGQQSKTSVTSSVSCRFFNIVSTNPATGAVLYPQDSLAVLLPPTTTVASGDTLVSTDTGYVGTFTVGEVKPAYALGALHHYTAQLARLP